MLQRFQSFSSDLRYFQSLLQVCSLCDLFRVLLQVFLAWSAVFIFSLIKHYAYQLLFQPCFDGISFVSNSSSYSMATLVFPNSDEINLGTLSLVFQRKVWFLGPGSLS